MLLLRSVGVFARAAVDHSRSIVNWSYCPEQYFGSASRNGRLPEAACANRVIEERNFKLSVGPKNCIMVLPEVWLTSSTHCINRKPNLGCFRSPEASSSEDREYVLDLALKLSPAIRGNTNHIQWVNLSPCAVPSTPDGTLELGRLRNV